MTHPKHGDLAIRARLAFERTIADERGEVNRPIDPIELARLEQAVRSLRRLDRDILLAVRLDALSYDVIAERHGLSIKQVEWRLARALREIGAFMRREPPHRRRRWLDLFFMQTRR